MDAMPATLMALRKKNNMKMVGMQQGDVMRTFADVSRLQKACGYKPCTTLYSGIKNLYDWYVESDFGRKESMKG